MEAFVSLPVTDKEVIKLKQKYQPSAKLGPHITVLPPGELRRPLEKTIGNFNMVKQIGGLVLQTYEEIEVLGSGGGGVLAIIIKRDENLLQLREAYQQWLSGSTISNDHDWPIYTPHVTIARYNSPENAEILMEQLAGEAIPPQIETAEPKLLLRKDQTENWQEI